MRLHHLSPLLLAGAMLTRCSQPPSPGAAHAAAAQPQPARFNSTPLVTGQYPATNFDTAGPEQAFEPVNSLPPGAANAPVK